MTTALPTFRRPDPPSPIERYDLVHPEVPPSLDGTTILHLTDTHVRRGRPFTPARRTLADAIRRTHADLVCLTGDYMTRPGDEPAALRSLRALVEACSPPLGIFGIFGNHDSVAFERGAAALPGVRWLHNESVDVPGRPGLRLLGASYPEDAVGALLSLGPPRAGAFTLALAHYPTEAFALGDAGVQVLLAGHTHGGQVRLSPRFAPHTSSDLPPHLASGLMRYRRTIVAVSRGLGAAVISWRFNCPARALYSLRRLPRGGRGLDHAQPVARGRRRRPAFQADGRTLLPRSAPSAAAREVGVDGVQPGNRCTNAAADQVGRCTG